MNISKIAASIQKYKNIDPDLKHEADTKILNAYMELNQLYTEKHENDEELKKDIEAYNELMQATSYSIENDPLFERTVFYDDDEDTSFSQAEYYRIKTLYEEWPKEKERIETEIEKIEKVRKVMPFYKTRAKLLLENDLKYAERDYKGFKESLKKIKLQHDFLRKNSDLIEDMQVSIDKRLQKYAKEAINEKIDEYPYIASKKMPVKGDPVFISYYANILNKEINKINNEAQLELDDALECGI